MDDSTAGSREDERQEEGNRRQANIGENPNEFFVPKRMELSKDEQAWAWDIKSAVEATAELDDISDFMCAQLAIIHKEDTETALDKAHRLQEIRQEFEIEDTFETSFKTMELFVTLHPGYLVTLMNDDGKFVMVVDSSKKPTATELRSLRGGVEKFLHGVYCLFHVLNPDFEAIRKGTFLF